MVDERYSFRKLKQAAPGVRLAELSRLAQELTARLGAGSNFEKDILAIIEDLRALGHDLWNFDQDVEWQIWSHDYATPRPGAGLFLRFDAPSRVEVTWAEPKRADP